MQVDRSRGELVITAVLFAVAVFFIWGALRMPAGSFAVPGPGTVPSIVGGLLALTTLALFVKTLLARAKAPEARREMRIAPVAIILAALTGVALAIDRAGFVITLSVFLFIMLRAFSKLSTLRSAIAAVVVTFLANWFFVNLLGVNLPHWR